MRLPYKIRHPMTSRTKSAFEFHMLMSNKTIDSYLKF